MPKYRSLFPTFIIFLVLSIVLVILSENMWFGFVSGIVEIVTHPFQQIAYATIHASTANTNTDLQKLQDENLQLTKQLAAMKTLERDNAAYHDQFQTTKIVSTSLLAARIIGMPGYIPNISYPSSIIIDKGISDGLHVGSVAVYQDNVVGQVQRASSHLARVSLISSKNTSMTVRDSQTNALGLLVGQENGVMLLGNVVLSDSLHTGDVVVTKGDEDEKGNGYPPDLVIGKIVSVAKQPSNLFQSAEVQSLVTMPQLETVFIIVNTK